MTACLENKSKIGTRQPREATNLLSAMPSEVEETHSLYSSASLFPSFCSNLTYFLRPSLDNIFSLSLCLIILDFSAPLCDPRATHITGLHPQ